MKETNKTILNKRPAMPAIADVIPYEVAEKHLEFVGDDKLFQNEKRKKKSEGWIDQKQEAAKGQLSTCGTEAPKGHNLPGGQGIHGW